MSNLIVLIEKYLKKLIYKLDPKQEYYDILDTLHICTDKAERIVKGSESFAFYYGLDMKTAFFQVFNLILFDERGYIDRYMPDMKNKSNQDIINKIEEMKK